MPVVARIKNLDRLKDFLGLEGIAATVRIGIVIEGPASAYALVWEWGRSDCKPGPKTLWGVNPDGDTRVLTRTAPSGFIRVNMARYRQFIREEFAAVNWTRVRESGFERMVEAVLRNAALRCADLIADTAPIDTGELRRAIRTARISVKDVQPLDKLSVRTRIKGTAHGPKWYQSNKYLRQHVRVFNPHAVESLDSYLKGRGK